MSNQDKKTAETLSELSESYLSVHGRLQDIAKRIEINGDFGEEERCALADLRNDCEDIASALDGILKGVSYAA